MITADQANELRRRIKELLQSAVATANGTQIPKPGKVGHAARCIADLDAFITSLAAPDENLRTVDVSQINRSCRTSEFALTISFKSIDAADKFQKDIRHGI